MTHFLLLIKKQTMMLGECQQGSYSPFPYKGNHEEYWTEKDSSFWKEFWGYVFREKRFGPEDQIALSILFHIDEADFPKMKTIIDWPWRDRIASLRMQPICQVLPEIACKEGLLKKNSPIYVTWDEETWEVNAQQAELATSPTFPYSFKDHHILTCFAAPWPVPEDSAAPRTMSGNPDTLLARYVDSSKIEAN